MESIKAELREWEREFKVHYGRCPTIADATEEIRGKYKSLAKMAKSESAAAATEQEMPRPSFTCKSGVLNVRGPTLYRTGSASTKEQRANAIAQLSVGPTMEFSLKSSSTAFCHGYTSSAISQFNQEATSGNRDLGSFSQRFPSEIVTDDELSDDTDGSGDDDVSLEEECVPETTAQQQNISENGDSLKRAKIIEPNDNVPGGFASFKFEPNYVRINMKRDWRARHVPLARESRSKDRAKSFFMQSESFSQPSFRDFSQDAISTALDALQSTQSPTAATSATSRCIPMCGHQVPCIERVVKKAATGNKGRIFFSCSLGREGSCGFFQWKDDTSFVAQNAFKERYSSNRSKAIDSPNEARLVKLPSLSVAELKIIMRRLGGKLGAKKKSELVDALRCLWRAREEEARDLRNATDVDLNRILQKVFFHDEFLPGQHEAIARILDGKSTFVVRATGSGKSLIYQLPSFVTKGLSIVISPLVSLMQDQLEQLPPGLVGRLLSGPQKDQAETVADLLLGHVDVLFMAPERLFTSSFQTLVRKLGTVDLVCVDEAHCISAWSHNFRPSYLRLGKAIKSLFPSATILALSATATRQVQDEICARLGIDKLDGGIQTTGSWTRANLKLLIEKQPMSDDRRFARLCELLLLKVDVADGGSKRATAKEVEVEPTIIYTSTKNETKVLSERLVAKGFAAEPYHAGMELHDRRRVQAEFLCGKLQIVVATVAFGMGLNKLDVRRVVHYRAPKSIEGFLQEVGRAGRDGKPSTCITFLDDSCEELRRSLALARSDGIEESQLRHFLSMIQQGSAKSSFSLIIDSTCKALDCREGVVETLLVLLEEDGLIELGPTGYARAQLAFCGNAAACTPFVRKAMALARTSGDSAIDLIELGRLAAEPGGPTLTISEVIKLLSKARDEGVLTKMSMIDPCWFIKWTKGWELGETKALISKLKRRYDELENGVCDKIALTHDALAKGLSSNMDMIQSVSEYLDGENASNVPFSVAAFKLVDAASERSINADAKSLLRDPQFALAPKCARTARAAVRIMQAVPSPVFGAQAWAKHRLWGRYKDYAFADLYRCIFNLFNLDT